MWAQVEDMIHQVKRVPTVGNNGKLKDIFDYKHDVINELLRFSASLDLDTPELRKERRKQVEQMNNRLVG